ncbi:probable starch synthase 4, chloroplastic/amyloplastic isoform X2 [Manihot esculenta]|uniref:probable starch synthase 4, chloroplastic/amyloplastic isoform X2 n=1 Tax=Manihot esculenta TaxID=3983 RepID=UPI000B5D7FCA|nr:probable starch synthase 4, chloroplastic/amyloplastic isoform X2 [Manihot esculenta]
MEISMKAAILFPPPFPKSNTAHWKPVKAPSLRFLRRNGEGNALFRAHSKLEVESDDNAEMPQEKFGPSNFESEVKHNHIWQLFKEAQRNILYLNNQRLLAVEELKKANQEKQLLLDRIEQLEAEKQAGFGKESSNLRKAIMSSKSSVADISFDNLQKSDAELLSELRNFSYGSKKSGFHIIHICTEMAPVIEVGSLASYVTGLSCALLKAGHLPEVILPKYASLNLNEIQGLREIEAEFYSYFEGQLHGNKIWTGVVNGIGVTFIQPLYYSSFFNREKVYGYSDDFERFAYFSRASLDYITKSGKQPDVLHTHNWETAIVGPLFWDIFAKQGLGGTRILLTCHGFESQGLEQPEKLVLCGLDPGRLHRPDRLQDNSKPHIINILKGGVVYSNKVAVVSSMNSKGRIIHSLSHGLESTLSIHSDKLLVTPYGFDDSTWDPSKDRFLPKNYNKDDLKGKAVCKVALRERLGLSENSSTILVGCIFSEMSDSDADKLKAVVWNATGNSVQFIFMGSKIPSANRSLESLQKELQGENVRFINKYDEAVSHLIFAGSDIILCQSFHDPLLQVPLKALKYGAAPVALASNDNRFRSVADHEQEATKFTQLISSTFGNMSLSEALNEINNNPSKWRRSIINSMAMDFSWNAECYDIHVSAYTALKSL